MSVIGPCFLQRRNGWHDDEDQEVGKNERYAHTEVDPRPVSILIFIAVRPAAIFIMHLQFNLRTTA